MWVGSRRIIDEHPEFNPEVDWALREYRGRGMYRYTGERIAPNEFCASGILVENEQDFEMMFDATR
tara:strand:- start:297 stop:494 length:198 start_codon:yes stop_codon:yes gene_type:complete